MIINLVVHIFRNSEILSILLEKSWIYYCKWNDDIDEEYICIYIYIYIYIDMIFKVIFKLR